MCIQKLLEHNGKLNVWRFNKLNAQIAYLPALQAGFARLTHRQTQKTKEQFF